jgi:protein-tyrosine-phosphatase
MAEGLMNAMGKGKFKAYSAGSHPGGKVNAFALLTLEDLGISSEGFRSKDWDEFAKPDAPQIDFIFTVCDNAKGEVCPIWPGKPMTAHWGVEDPSLAQGSDEDIRREFGNAARILKRRIELFMNLPMEKLEGISLQQKLADIGISRA